MSEINPTDHKSISSRIFLMKVFVKLFVNCLGLKEVISAIKRVEAEFSILRDYGLSKRHYRVYHICGLDPENMMDFFEKV